MPFEVYIHVSFCLRRRGVKGTVRWTVPSRGERLCREGNVGGDHAV